MSMLYRLRNKSVVIFVLTDALPTAVRAAYTVFRQKRNDRICHLKRLEMMKIATDDTALRELARTDLSKASQNIGDMLTDGTPFEPQLPRTKPTNTKDLIPSKWFNEDDATYGPEQFGKSDKD